ncbi:MAG: NAD+ synthase [Candidatus Omnitrophica bacterium]|nr:NAD+ synthase [Candidatus Omnitrophota bacterium]
MQTQSIRIAIAQINPTVGDLSGNADLIIRYLKHAEGLGSDIVMFPELALTGYPPEDLLHKPKFIDDSLMMLKRLVTEVDDIGAVVGFVDKKGNNLFNAAAIIHKKKIMGVYHKMILPNYGVFDEQRYFTPGVKPLVFTCGGNRFGLAICEDIWRKDGPVEQEVAMGAGAILTINASPYHAGKINEREAVLRAQAKRHRVTLAYANLVGGQDELVFDGQSLVMDAKGACLGRAKAFQEDILLVDVDSPSVGRRPMQGMVAITHSPKQLSPAPLGPREVKPLQPIAEVYEALLLGLRDYVRKNGFSKVVIGSSGGIDSALVATLAVDALGSDNVTTVFMPSRYSSQESEIDARKLAENLKIQCIVLSIELIYKMYLMILEPLFSGLGKNIAEENLQARIRGNILMALSNKFGWLVLTTGNKSEMSTGYATLYGDMAGGFSVIKDVPKTLVYELARYRNAQGAASDSSVAVIPERILTKAPTAELKPNQKDTDTLPAYEQLDPILKAYVEEDKELRKIVLEGFDPATVAGVLAMVDKSEYKRRQAPPGVKITPKAFGRDRRMPITNKYRG